MKIKYLIPLILIFALLSPQTWAPPTSSGKKEKEKMDRNLGRQESSSDEESAQGAVGGTAQPLRLEGPAREGRLLLEKNLTHCHLEFTYQLSQKRYYVDPATPCKLMIFKNSLDTISHIIRGRVWTLAGGDKKDFVFNFKLSKDILNTVEYN